MLVAELAEALQLAHEQGLVHGDLKPDHILLGEDGQTRRVRFWRAAAAGDGFGRPVSLIGHAGVHGAGAVRGEVGIGDTLSEVYALGVILYEIMTGVLPFTAVDSARFSHEIQKDEPKPPRRLCAIDPGCARGRSA